MKLYQLPSNLKPSARTSRFRYYRVVESGDADEGDVRTFVQSQLGLAPVPEWYESRITSIEPSNSPNGWIVTIMEPDVD